MIKNVFIGNVSDNSLSTGVTVIYSAEGFISGVDVRGSASGTREIELIKCGNLVERINAFVLTGGSAFGLESATGVMQFLSENNIGYQSGSVRVPIVSSAVIFDLEYKNNTYPTKEMGYLACKNAKNEYPTSGSIGAGTGATVGKLFGNNFCSKGGLGIFTEKLGNVEVTAIFAVNALGDVFDEETNSIVAGLKDENGNFIDTEKMILQLAKTNLAYTNTTIGCVLTNAKINREQANKLASISHNGLARSIKPVHTMYDGDTVFVASTAEEEIDFNVLCVLAVNATKKAILNAVKNN